MAKAIKFEHASQNAFSKKFLNLCTRHQAWQIWSDFVVASAISIANAFDSKDSIQWQERDAEYKTIMGRYDEDERQTLSELLNATVDALEEEPDQDFLGEMFMGLELSSHWHGQFFTPYHICRMMAEMMMVEAPIHIKQKGWVGICDPACGAGALLVAARNYLARNPCGALAGHQQTLFVAQDIDRTAALMCFIHLSLLGCAGYVVIGNTLTDPAVSVGGNPILPIKGENQEIWCTPLFHDAIWIQRQIFAQMAATAKNLKPAPIFEPVETKIQDSQIALF